MEQLTYLLLKMADEQMRLLNKPSTIPKGLDWPSLLEKDGDVLEVHYRHILESLGKEKGMLGVIFRWLKDESLEESENLPDPNLLAQDIVENLEGALEQFSQITTDLGEEGAAPR